MTEQDLKQMVREVIQDIGLPNAAVSSGAAVPAPAPAPAAGQLDVDVADITAVDLQKALYVENPTNRAAYEEMMAATPARIGVGRAGPRPNTKTLLRFRADHAAAMDAVFNDVDPALVEEMGLFAVQTSAADKQHYLMDPAAGRVFDAENEKLVKENCKQNVQVQIIVSDGLSSSAVRDNIRDLLPALEQGLKNNGLATGTNLFVRFGRVGIMDTVAKLLNAEVTLLFVGERPGLVTNASLSCYMTYGGHPGIAESARTVVSNIYKNGTPPSEAGAYIADIAKKMLQAKASGLDLKL